MLGYGLGNDERGRIIKIYLAIQAHMQALKGEKEKAIKTLKILASKGSLKIATDVLKKLGIELEFEPEKCTICNCIFNKINDIVAKILNELEKYEYKSFLVGVRVPSEVEESEDELRSEFNIEYGENIRNELSREIGKRVQSITGRVVDFKNPDVVVLVNPFTNEVEIQSNPLYIAGRYKKLVRGIPQSKWICMKCMGKGCERCGWTGKMYEYSVEEFISEPILEATFGEDSSFHAAGREDVDARMLGRGRPFIVEVKRPKKRFLDLRKLESEINSRARGMISVSNLKFASKSDLRKLKRGEHARKKYRVLVKFSRPISDSEIKMLIEELSDCVIKQRTPTRVLHRRVDKIREKKVYSVSIERISSDTVRLFVECDGGLYVKELVNGDNGRTKPSISEILNAKAIPIELDVLDVMLEGF